MSFVLQYANQSKPGATQKTGELKCHERVLPLAMTALSIQTAHHLKALVLQFMQLGALALHELACVTLPALAEEAPQLSGPTSRPEQSQQPSTSQTASQYDNYACEHPHPAICCPPPGRLAVVKLNIAALHRSHPSCGMLVFD